MDDVQQWERKAIAGLLGLLTTAFMVWAGVVWNGTDKVMNKIESLAIDANKDRIEQQQYRAVLERRLTIQEQQLDIVKQRQAWVIEQMHAAGTNGVP
jgi:hypothetical protein